MNAQLDFGVSVFPSSAKLRQRVDKELVDGVSSG